MIALTFSLRTRSSRVEATRLANRSFSISMPIRRLHTAAHICAGAFEDPSRTISTLLMRWQVRIGQDAHSGKVRERRVTGIAQEQRLLPIADEHERVAWD